MWVPGLLLLLSAAVIWVLASGLDSPTSEATDHPTAEASPGDLEGGEPRPGVLEPVAPPPESQRTEVPVLPTHGTLRGRVVAERWVIWPAGITLTLASQAGGPPLETVGVSEEQPRFLFQKVPFGHYRLTLTAPEFLQQKLLITVSIEQPDQFLAVPLAPAASIVGTVVDVTGLRVARIPVAATFYSTAPGRSQVPHTASTDQDGNFRITGLRDGEFEVYVGTFRNPLSEIKIIGISREAPEAWVSFTVGVMGSAKVQVAFLDGPEVAATDWRSLRIQATRMGSAPGFSESLALDKDGSVWFTALPPGDYSFVAYGGPYRRVMRRASVAPDLPLEITIPMRRYPQGPRR